MRRLFYCNMPDKRLSDSASGSPSKIAPLRAGENERISFRFLEGIGAGLTEKILDLAALRVSLGYLDKRPESGTYKIQLGEGASTVANTTAALDWNAPVAVVVTALNALSGGTADFAGLDVPGGMEVWRTGGGAITFAIRENNIRPVSIVRVVESDRSDGRHIYELRPTVTPVAFTDTMVSVLPDAPSIATIQEGGTSDDGATVWAEIQAVTVPPDFRGTYQFRRGYQKSDLLDINSTVAQIADAINAMLDGDGVVTTALVADGLVYITFGGDLLGVNVGLLEVPVHSAPPPDVAVDLDLRKPELEAALRETNIAALRLEGVADIYIDPDDHTAGTTRTVIFSEVVTVVRPVAWDGLALAQNIDWLRPWPQDYVEFDPGQVLTGTQHYVATIGGSSASIVHSLGTMDVSVTLRVGATGAMLVAGTDYSAVVTGANTVSILFSPAVAAASVVAVITTAGPVSVFQNHQHTVPQVLAGGGYPSLASFMDDIGARVETLEDVLPSVGVAATATQASGISIELPETKEILFWKGSADDEAKVIAEGLDALSVAPRGPLMLPALHLAAPMMYAGGALPALAAGEVYYNNSGATVDLGRGIYGGKVRATEYFGSDGRVRYALSKSGGTSSYFPRGFERELWRIFINDRMLRVNRVLDVQFGLALRLLNATSNAQWTLVIERGTAPSQATPSTTAANLENVEWEPDPILSQRLILTQNRQTHGFGARIDRKLVASVDTISLDVMEYGVWEGNNAAAPTTANFALRARLVDFDTENALASDARGHVAYEIIGAMASAKPLATVG